MPVDNEKVTDLDDDLPPMAERIEFARKILAHPDFKHPKKYARMRDTLTLLLRQYELEPGQKVTQNRILDEVFGGRFDEFDTHARKTIGYLREWLADYFIEDEPESAMVVNIPLSRYVLEFRRRNFQLRMRPTEWFWSEYLRSDEPTLFGKIEDSKYGGLPTVGRPGWDSKLEFSWHCLLETYRMLSRVLPELPEIHEPEWNHSRWWGERRPLIAVGLPSGYCRPISEYWAEWSGSTKPFVLTIDPHRRVLLSDPHPEQGSPAILLDSDSTMYGLVSRIRPPQEPPMTVIQAGSGHTIARIMDLLTTDQELEPIVSSEALGGPTLSNRAPDIFQLLFRVEVESSIPSYDDMGDDGGPGLGPAEFVCARVMAPPK